MAAVSGAWRRKGMVVALIGLLLLAGHAQAQQHDSDKLEATTTTTTRNVINNENMNRGFEYTVANSANYAADYRGEFFEVYSGPISTLYSQVHWRLHDNIALPAEIVQRFAHGKVMAVTGYEVDQVFLHDDKTERRVPITWAYNHHYGAFLRNSNQTRFQHVQHKKTQPVPVGAGMHLKNLQVEFLHDDKKNKNSTVEYPQMQFFSEANGGEMRGSYHGYPAGYAQLIQSPDTFSVVPMQIDTWDRERMTNATYVPGGPLPRQTAPLSSAGYNALLECPCSTRLHKEWKMTYNLHSPAAICTKAVQNASECEQAARSLLPARYMQLKRVNATYKPGCSVAVLIEAEEEHEGPPVVHAVWNANRSAESRDHNMYETSRERFVSFSQLEPSATARGINNKLVSAEVSLDVEERYVNITLAGPANAWFGMGFGTSSMCLNMQADECPGGGPYAIIVSGDTVHERKLGYHGKGTVLLSSVKVLSNKLSYDSKFRIVRLERPMKGLTEDHFTFERPPQPTESTFPLKLPVIMARGCSLEFAQHCGHGPAELVFVQLRRFAYDLNYMPVCQAGLQGSIDGDPFVGGLDRCKPFPWSNLVEQRNPTCSIDTYQGGLSCCRDAKSLLDADQEQPWPDQPLEYRLKFRFYFEEYSAPSAHAQKDDDGISPSHQALVRLYHQTEFAAGEYDIPVCAQNTPVDQCVHTLTARWQVRDMLLDCEMRDASWCTGVGSANDTLTAGVQLIYAAPHCHAGTCLSMELYNADTGRLLCRVEPLYGQDSGQPYQEEEYLTIPPCVWSHDDSTLQAPELLTLDTNLLSIKRNNNTFGHTGEMASWQMRGIVVPRNEKKASPPVVATKLAEEKLDKEAEPALVVPFSPGDSDGVLSSDIDAAVMKGKQDWSVLLLDDEEDVEVTEVVPESPQNEDAAGEQARVRRRRPSLEQQDGGEHNP